VVNGHSFILIRQMAALLRRAPALAEVCTVPRETFGTAVRRDLSRSRSYVYRSQVKVQGHGTIKVLSFG